MKVKKFRLKTGHGKFLRLTTPTKNITITDEPRLLTEEELKLVGRYVEEYKPEPRKKKEEPKEEVLEDTREIEIGDIEE